MNFSKIKKIEAPIHTLLESFEQYNIYHTREWHDCIKDTFGWEVQGVTGYDENRLVFFLPFLSKSRLSFRKKDICLPLSHKVGCLQNKAISNEEVENLSKVIGNDFEIHDNCKSLDLLPGSSTNSSNFITTLDFSKFEDVESLYKSFDYKSIKYPINRAIKNNITINDDFSIENINIFYKLELAVRKRQGSPMYPRSFFNNIYKHFKDSNLVKIYIAFYDGKPISGAIFWTCNKVTTYAYSASTNDKNIKKLGGNELLLWQAIKDAYTNNMSTFDFGTTPKSLPGLKKFKEKWGGESRELDYTYFTSDGKVKTIQRDGKLVKKVSQILKALPIPIFQFIGPIILKRVV